MKKLVLTLLAATLVSGALAQNSSTSFPDIPANHWAAAAVSRIANLGIVIGFPDGTFRGNEAFTRYQAALVISRLLDVVNQNVNSSLAMTKSDIESLRNAVQGVASDVASQGVRLSSAESAIASLSDDVTANKSSIASNSSRLDKLEQDLQTMQNQPSSSNAGAANPAVLRDLQNQIASQRVAIDTAQAQADAAAKRANDAHDLAQQAMSQAQQNAAQIASASQALQNLTDKVNSLANQASSQPSTPSAPPPPATSNLPGLQGDVQRNTSDIANIREFVILLRRDQVALRDRVAALESSDQQQSQDIASLQKRVTALEQNPLGLSGSIELSYFVGRTLGYNFDIDRAYGVGNTRSMGSSIFSSGATELGSDEEGDSGYQTDVSEVAQDRQDITQQAGAVDATLTLDLSASLNGAGSPNALNSFDAVVSLNLVKATGLTLVDANGDPYSGDGSTSVGYIIHVTDFTTTFDGIGAAPLKFSFGTNVDTTFTPYVVNTDDPGFVATLTSPDFLSFINPSLQVVYTAPTLGQDGTTALSNVYTRGAHLSLNPFTGITIGGTFVQSASNAGDKNNVNNNNITDTVYGVDANASVSIFNLGFEWDQGSQDNQTGANAATQSLLYAKLNVDGKSLPILNSLDVNYRDIPQNWEAGQANNYAMIYNAGSNSSNYPFAIADGDGTNLGQRGYGASADLSLFILDLSGYYDNYDFTLTAATPDSVQAYGIDATANLFAGFSLSGFFHNVTLNGTQVGDLTDHLDASGAAVATAAPNEDLSMDHNYDTGFGVTLKHDGSAANALIKGLNLEATYKMTGASYNTTTIDVKGDYTLDVSIVTLTPYAEYKTVSHTYTADDTSTIQVGAGLSTTPLAVPLQPSLQGAVNYRTTDHSNAATYTATELQWSVGLVLNKFLFDHSTLTAKYGSWSGQNIEVAMNTNGTGDGATDISNGDVYNGSTNTQQSVNGYEVIWNYYDLELSYGVYQSHRENVASPTSGASDASAQAFQITYTVDF